MPPPLYQQKRHNMQSLPRAARPDQVRQRAAAPEQSSSFFRRSGRSLYGSCATLCTGTAEKNKKQRDYYYKQRIRQKNKSINYKCGISDPPPVRSGTGSGRTMGGISPQGAPERQSTRPTAQISAAFVFQIGDETMNIRRKCPICGENFWTGNGKAKYCSDDCRKAAHQSKQKEWREKHPDYLKEWRKSNAGS